jgi:hypothetical protein
MVDRRTATLMYAGRSQVEAAPARKAAAQEAAVVDLNTTIRPKRARVHRDD